MNKNVLVKDLNVFFYVLLMLGSTKNRLKEHCRDVNPCKANAPTKVLYVSFLALKTGFTRRLELITFWLANHTFGGFAYSLVYFYVTL